MATFTFYQYETNNQGVISGSGTVSGTMVTITDDGILTVGESVTSSGTPSSATVSGLYTGPNGSLQAGDFYFQTGGPTNVFYSQSSTLAAGTDVNGTGGSPAPNYTTTVGATYNLTCFRPGTLIATERGEVAVEHLRIGDRLPTADGEIATVRWIGKQTISTVFMPRETSFPICISKGALGGGLPRRDLYVSPSHAMLVDGLLVHAAALVNGSTIYQVAEMPQRFEYLHIETDGHHAILAEGAAAETFVDNVPRTGFDNWREHAALYPDWQPIAEMALPRVGARRLLPAAIRDRLAAVAAELTPAATKVA
jgi:hypothetical protein